MNGVTTGRLTTSSNRPEERIGYSMLVHPDTFDTMQAEVNALRSVTVDNVNMQVNQAMMYGTGIAQTIWYDESVNVPTGVLPTLPEELALPMTDAERLASDGRERAFPSLRDVRYLTVAEIERLNNQGGR